MFGSDGNINMIKIHTLLFLFTVISCQGIYQIAKDKLAEGLNSLGSLTLWSQIGSGIRGALTTAPLVIFDDQKSINTDSLITYFKPSIVLAGLLALMALITLIVAPFACICCICNKPKIKKHSNLKKLVISVFLFSFIALVGSGLVIAYFSTFAATAGVTMLESSLNDTFTDANSKIDQVIPATNSILSNASTLINNSINELGSLNVTGLVSNMTTPVSNCVTALYAADLKIDEIKSVGASLVSTASTASTNVGTLITDLGTLLTNTQALNDPKTLDGTTYQLLSPIDVSTFQAQVAGYSGTIDISDLTSALSSLGSFQNLTTIAVTVQGTFDNVTNIIEAFTSSSFGTFSSEALSILNQANTTVSSAFSEVIPIQTQMNEYYTEYQSAKSQASQYQSAASISFLVFLSLSLANLFCGFLAIIFRQPKIARL